MRSVSNLSFSLIFLWSSFSSASASSFCSVMHWDFRQKNCSQIFEALRSKGLAGGKFPAITDRGHGIGKPLDSSCRILAGLGVGFWLD